MTPTPSLPAGIRVCLFDLDGVVTKTDVQHRQCWKRTFDPFLAGLEQEDQPPFTLTDYLRHVDGLPRHDAVRRFLGSRGQFLRPGSPGDPPDARTVHGLANRKDALLCACLAEEFVEPYPGTVRFIEAVRAAGMSTAIVSASSHCAQVLDASALSGLFDLRVDGRTARAESLHGKPSPDSYLHAASTLRVTPQQAAVFEDGPSGLRAAVRGGFGFVVAVDRCDEAAVLREEEPDLLVHDLAELLLPPVALGAPHATNRTPDPGTAPDPPRTPRPEALP
ncbi:HAD family hydrolase [Streptomyces sp. NPDC049813]|uniref:HAD family hydrolase n=1 Tax=Streptomyces sp. NPDC049813 TaxID=3365597 RepID=UPI0037B91754